MRILTITALLLAAPATASSPAAWSAFQAQTAQACRAAVAAVAPRRARLEVKVSATGTERFGVALVLFRRGKATDTHLCIMNKRTGRAEIDPGAIGAMIAPPRT